MTPPLEHPQLHMLHVEHDEKASLEELAQAVFKNVFQQLLKSVPPDNLAVGQGAGAQFATVAPRYGLAVKIQIDLVRVAPAHAEEAADWPEDIG